MTGGAEARPVVVVHAGAGSALKDGMAFNGGSSVLDDMLRSGSQRRWMEAAGVLGRPRNPVTGTAYRGGNMWIASANAVAVAAEQGGRADPRFVSFAGAKVVGGHVRKGAKAITIMAPHGPVGADGKPGFRAAHVFNVRHVEGAAAWEPAPVGFDPVEEVQCIARGLEAVVVEGAPFAGYDRTERRVLMPHPAAFSVDRTPEEARLDHAGVLVHELAHYGHALLGLMDPATRLGTAAYARDEVVAELAAARVCAALAIGYPQSKLDENAAYVASWRESVRGDARWFMAAAREAEAVSWLLLSHSPGAAADIAREAMRLIGEGHDIRSPEVAWLVRELGYFSDPRTTALTDEDAFAVGEARLTGQEHCEPGTPAPGERWRDMAAALASAVLAPEEDGLPKQSVAAFLASALADETPWGDPPEAEEAVDVDKG